MKIISVNRIEVPTQCKFMLSAWTSLERMCGWWFLCDQWEDLIGEMRLIFILSNSFGYFTVLIYRPIVSSSAFSVIKGGRLLVWGPVAQKTAGDYR